MRLQRMRALVSLGLLGCVAAALVPAAEIPDPQALRLKTILNGEVVQEAPTADMIFSVAQIVAFVTEAITLEPGDLILTGTPAGVGIFRDPELLLKPELEVIAHLEVEAGPVADLPQGDGVVLPALGGIGIRQVGQRGRQRVASLLNLRELGLHRLELG